MDWTFLTETTFLGNSPLRWAIAVLALVAVLLLLRGLRRLARRRLASMAARSRNVVDDVLSDLLASVRTPLMLAVGVWAAAKLLVLAPTWEIAIDKGMTLLLIVYAAIWGNRALTMVLEHYRGVEGLDSSRRTTLSALSFLGRVVLYSLLALAALDNLGIDITALLAGLGIASIGVGLALQNIMSDLFGSLSIILDKPFEIGDYILVDDLSGTVENVGLRTTRVRSLSGEQLVFSNTDLLQSRIRNYKRMRERRVVFAFGVTYETPREILSEIPVVVREIVEAQDQVRFDRAHFQGFGDSALNFETVYWTLDPDYTLFMDVQQAINLELVRAFEERGIAFAYPTRTVHLLHATQDGAVAPPNPTGEPAPA